MTPKIIGKASGAVCSGHSRRGRPAVLLLVFFVAGALYAVAAAYVPAPAQAVERDADNGGHGAPWWTADSGGGVSSGGGYRLKGTSGQPDAAASAGGGYTLHGGFWRIEPRRPLTIQPLADQTAPAGSLAAIQVVARDGVGGPLHYSATGLPLGLQIDAATGLISGQLVVGSAGVYPVTVTVTNGRGASALTAFTFTVTEPTALEPEDEPAFLLHLYLPLVAQ